MGGANAVRGTCGHAASPTSRTQRPSVRAAARWGAWILTAVFALSLFSSLFTLPMAAAGTGKADAGSPAGRPFHVYTMETGSTEYHQLVSVANDIQPKWSPDGTRVAFASNAGNAYRIHLVNADGTGLHVIAPGPGNSLQPSWSPDGTKLAFASDRSGDFNIYTVNADGTGLRSLTSSSASDRSPAWSPSGARIAFASDRRGNFDLYTVNASGTGLTGLTSADAQDKSPAWSPDG
jgi:dipeptidyl aminopeptidase/acylaminoacyl peptidase